MSRRAIAAWGGSVRRRALSSAAAAAAGHAPLQGKPTALLSRHVALGGQIVDFAGYQLPVLYEKRGVLKEHLHTRDAASVFDVSHMGQVKIRGDKRVEFLEKLVVADVRGLKPGQSALTVFTLPTGGIIDDAIVTNAGDHLHVVVNGACKDKDMAHMKEHVQAFPGVTVDLLPSSETVLIALQGPKAAAVVERLLDRSAGVDVGKMPFMTAVESVKFAGLDRVRLSRCGYTGEDGFEISAYTADAGRALFDAVVQADYVAPAGLGARDSLRLEAGLCLYGNDIDSSTTPAEAGLAWLVHPRRRAERGFLGADSVLRQLPLSKDVKAEAPPARRRVGLHVPFGAPARQGANLFAGDVKVGVVTSGTFSPSLKAAIAMGYVEAKHAAIGSELQVEVRGKRHLVKVVKMPFVETKYFQVKKA